MKLVYNIDIVFNKKTSLDLTGFFIYADSNPKCNTFVVS